MERRAPGFLHQTWYVFLLTSRRVLLTFAKLHLTIGKRKPIPFGKGIEETRQDQTGLTFPVFAQHPPSYDKPLIGNLACHILCLQLSLLWRRRTHDSYTLRIPCIFVRCCPHLILVDPSNPIFVSNPWSSDVWDSEIELWAL